MKYQLTGSVSLSKNTKPRSTRTELLRVDEDTGKSYRDYSHHIDKERTSWNRVLVNRDVWEVYDEHIGPCIDRYNAGQLSKGHPERCKSVDSYMDEIVAGERAKNATKRPRLWNDFIIQCGDMLSNEAWQVAEGEKVQPQLACITNDVYEEFLDVFQTKFPNLIITCAVIHNDEATPHMQVQYVPICHNNKRGLEVQVKLFDTLAESLDALGVQYNRKQNDGVKHAFNEVLDKMLTDIMRQHGIERVPGKKKDNDLGSQPVAELRKRSRLLLEKVKMIVDKGENPLDDLKAKRIPLVGTVYSEHDVKAMVSELMKERAVMIERAETAEEVGRREKSSRNEAEKHLKVRLQKREQEVEKHIKKRKASLIKKEYEADQALKEAQTYKWSLQDNDQQHRYKLLADELEMKKAEIDEAHAIRNELFLNARKEAEALKTKARIEAERLIREAKVVEQKEKVKMKLLEERYPDIASELENIMLNAQKANVDRDGSKEMKRR